MKRTYWSFYWPLAITGVSVILASQFQNGVLARYEDATKELAIFAYAYGTFTVFRAALVFVPQMANLLARSRPAHRVLGGFISLMGAGLSAPLVFMGVSDSGAALVGWFYGIEGPTLTAVATYLRFMGPLITIHAFRQYSQGLLIQMQSTGLVTALNLVHLATIFGALVGGYLLGWPAVSTLLSAQWTAAALHLVLLGLCLRRYYRLPAPEHEDLTYRRALAFFWPVAVTSVMFALSRPILYALVSRGPDALTQVAALRIAFDFAILFHQPLNQFRHLFATYGTDDLAGLRRFQIEVVLCLAAVMTLTSVTPLDSWVLTHLLGVGPPILGLAEEAFLVMCALPLVVGFRNYFHGIALARLTTKGMALGATLRVAAIYAVGGIASAQGLLDHRVASAILVMGFAAEAVVVLLGLRLSERAQRLGDDSAAMHRSDTAPPARSQASRDPSET